MSPCFCQAANHLSQDSDKHILYLETTRYLRNTLMPGITYVCLIFVISFLYSYRLIQEWNVCKRLGTMVDQQTPPYFATRRFVTVL
jgi:hypothetical protein